MNISEYNSYEPDNLAVVTAASCGTLLFVSMFYFSSMATNSYTATVATWCILSILIVVSVAYLLKKILPLVSAVMDYCAVRRDLSICFLGGFLFTVVSRVQLFTGRSFLIKTARFRVGFLFCPHY